MNSNASKYSRKTTSIMDANETISIIENAGLMGVPIPAVVVKAIEVLKENAENHTSGKEG